MQTMHQAGYVKPNMIPLTPQSHFIPQLYHKTVQGMSSLKTSSLFYMWSTFTSLYHKTKIPKLDVD